MIPAAWKQLHEESLYLVAAAVSNKRVSSNTRFISYELNITGLIIEFDNTWCQQQTSCKPLYFWRFLLYLPVHMTTVSYPRPGILSHCPVIPAIKFLCTIITPLGLPVEPLVYITKAKSEGAGLLGRMFATKCRRKILINSYLLSKYSVINYFCN